MQLVPDFYLENMKADSRQLRWDITLCEKDSWAGWQISDDDIESCDVVQELQDVGVPCAYIGQNIATFKVYNADGMFTTNKTENVSRYLKRGTKVMIENVAGSGSTLWPTWVFIGYIDTFEMDEDNQFCTITAYDSLHFLKNQKAPMFRPTGFYVDAKMNLYDFIVYYMTLCGCVQCSKTTSVEHIGVGFSVDKNLKYTPAYMFTEGETIGAVLESFAKVGLCAIYCNAYGNIVFTMLPKTRSVVYNFDDMTQVVSSKSAQLGYSEYTHVSVAVHEAWGETNLQDQLHTAFTSSSKAFPLGATNMSSVDLSSSRVPTSIRIVSGERITTEEKPTGTIAVHGPIQYITDYDFGLNKANLTFYSARGSVVDMTIDAYDMWETINNKVEVASPNYEDTFFLMKKVLEIDVPLITDDKYAEQIATTFSKMLLDSRDEVSCSVRGEPAIELLDCITVTNPRAAHSAEQILPTRISYSYDGSLSCEIDAIRYSAIAMVTYAFLAPGMYIPYDTGATYIQVKVQPEGTGIASGAGAYAIGDRAILSCIPFTGYKVSYWLNANGEKIATTDKAVVTVSEDATFTAVLEEDEVFTTFTLDINDAANTSVVLPPMSLTAASGTIDWGDGTVEDYDATVDVDHTYESTGTWPITLRAPIENFTYEIFANNSQINTFTAGSHMLYVPNGMFYNCSVKNVNLMPATNMQYVGNKALSKYSPSTVMWGINSAVNNTVIIRANNLYAVRTTGNIAQVPMFYKNNLVVGVNTYSGNNKQQNIPFNFGNTPLLSSVEFCGMQFGGYSNLKQLSYNALNYLSTSHSLNYVTDITIPIGPRFFYASTVPNVANVYLPYTINSIQVPPLTGTIKDVYLAANTSTVKVNVTDRTQSSSDTVINIHKSESTEVLLTGYTAAVNIITDGGV